MKKTLIATAAVTFLSMVSVGAYAAATATSSLNVQGQLDFSIEAQATKTIPQQLVVRSHVGGFTIQNNGPIAAKFKVTPEPGHIGFNKDSWIYKNGSNEIRVGPSQSEGYEYDKIGGVDYQKLLQPSATTPLNLYVSNQSDLSKPAGVYTLPVTVSALSN